MNGHGLSDVPDVAADNGIVVVSLEDGRALWMSPTIAEELSHQLLQAAFEARGQEVGYPASSLHSASRGR
jgi:hypothetical protein